MSGSQGSFMDGLTAACRENPLAAALIGGGALWLLIGSDRLKNAAGSVTSAAAPLADLGARAKRSAASSWEDAYGSMRNRASRIQDETSRVADETVRSTTTATSEAMSGAAETMSGAAGTIGERFDEGMAAARDIVDRLGRALPRKQTLMQAQSSLSDLMERQPLVLGAIGLAIGATVAGAIARSEVEDQWVGNLSDDLKADLKERAGAVSQSVQEASDTLKAELADAGAEYADRLQQAGRDALDASREKLAQ